MEYKDFSPEERVRVVIAPTYKRLVYDANGVVRDSRGVLMVETLPTPIPRGMSEAEYWDAVDRWNNRGRPGDYKLKPPSERSSNSR